MVRRLIALAAAAGAIFGIAAAVADSPVKQAAPTQIVSPLDADLARVCVLIRSTNGGVCLHV